MSNYDLMNDFIQHNYVGSVYKIGDKFDFNKEKGILFDIPNLLYYSVHNETEQKYFKLNNVHNCLNDKNYDQYYRFRIQILLNIKNNNFYIEKTYVDTKKRLDNLTQFDHENTMVIKYNDINDTNSFLIQVLLCLRNTVAHGGFNLIIDDLKRFNIVLLNNHKKGISFSYRNISNDNICDLSLLQIIYLDLINNIYDSKDDLLISNLKMLGYEIKFTKHFDDLEISYFLIAKGNEKILYIESFSTCHEELLLDIKYILNLENIKYYVDNYKIIKLVINLFNSKNRLLKEKCIETIKNKLEYKFIQVDVCKHNDNLMDMFLKC